MRLYISPMTEPIDILKDKINTVCVENILKFRNIVMDFLEENESGDLVFSQNYEPFTIKNNVCFISNYFDLQVSPSIIKKIYVYLEKLCVDELNNESSELKADIIKFLSKVSQICDFDFDYKPEISLCDVFKMQSLKPRIDSFDITAALLNYMSVINKYACPKCFVLLNAHVFFNNDEIKLLFNSLKYQGVFVIFLENMFSFERLDDENITIIDKDLCEIVAKDRLV